MISFICPKPMGLIHIILHLYDFQIENPKQITECLKLESLSDLDILSSDHQNIM